METILECHNTTKNIIYIGSFELPDKNAAAQRVIINAKLFKNSGYSVYLLGLDKTLKKHQPLLETKQIFENITYYRLRYPTNLFEWIKYITSISFIKELVKLQPSIIIAYDYPAIALNRLIYYCHRNKIKIVGDCTEWYEPQGGLLYKIIKKWDTKYRMEKVHSKLDGIITVSKYLFNYYKDKVRPILLLPPLVDKSMKKWKQEKIEVEPDCIHLIYAGSPGKKDRLDWIVLALSSLIKKKDIKVKFTVIGITLEEFYQLYEMSSLPSNVQDIIQFLGKLPHNNTLEKIKKADYVIFLRENNLKNTAGFPSKFPEALSCGTPVLTNLSSNLNMYMQSGKNGFVLDISSFNSLMESLYYPLSLNKDRIIEMKYYCLSINDFEFHQYTNPLSSFLYQLTDCK